jgi:heptosyltransferase III
VLVLRPGALGDTLLAVPALRALRSTFAPITLAAHAGTARLLQTLGEVTAGLAFDDPTLAWVFRDADPREEIVAWMSTPLPRARLVAPSRPSGEQHIAQYLLDSLSPLGVPRNLDAGPLHVAPRTSDEVLVHVGSGSPAKNWPARCFAETIERLRNVTLIVGEADRDAVHDVEHHIGRGLPHLEVGLLELAERLAGCRAYLGNDSGVSHLAGLCGARTVALFGPTDPHVWRPLGPRVAILRFDATPDEVASAVSA